MVYIFVHVCVASFGIERHMWHIFGSLTAAYKSTKVTKV